VALIALYICVLVCVGCGCVAGFEANPSCVKCKSSKGVVPIVYGHPLLGLWESADRGEVVLGGCVVDDDSPEWHCKTCKKSW
jgi:hypothetical protein